jgi:hypothetical protein
LCKIAGFNKILIYFRIERLWTGSITRGPGAPRVHRGPDPSARWMFTGVRPAGCYDSPVGTAGGRGGGEGRGGAVLALIGEREATEMAGDEREQEAAMAIGVE